LIADLGGEDNVSTQQRALVDLAVKAKLLLDSVDAWLLAQESLVTAKTKSLIPALRQRVTLAHTLERHLLVLGIHRRPKTLSLTELLAKDNTEDDIQDAKLASANGAQRPRNPDTGRFEPNSTADDKP